MTAARPGDSVRIHFVKRLSNGSVTASRNDHPLDVIVGVAHARLPGLGTALVGMAPGARATVEVPAESAYGTRDPLLVRRIRRSWFVPGAALDAGKWVRATDRRGHTRLVRIVEANDRVVVADLNHPWAGQSMTLEVELLDVNRPEPGHPDQS